MRLSTACAPRVAEPLSQFFARDGRIGLLYGNASPTRLALSGITLAAVNIIGSRGFLGVHRETRFTEKDVIPFPSFSRFGDHLRRSGEMIRAHSVPPSIALPRATATRNGSLKI